MAEKTLGIYKVIIPDAASTTDEKPDEKANHIIAVETEYDYCKRLVAKRQELDKEVKQNPEAFAARAELASLDLTKISERMLHALDELAKAGPVDPEKVSNVFSLYIAQTIANLDLKHIKVELCDLP